MRTGDDWGAGTEDAVWFSLGPSYEWYLDRPGENKPFKSGAFDTFILPPRGLKVEDIKYVRLRKGPDGEGGRWLLQGVEVWVNGNPLYRNGEIGTWLEGRNLEWKAPDFPRPAKD